MDDYRHDSYVAAQINVCESGYCWRCRQVLMHGCRHHEPQTACDHCGKPMPRDGQLRECFADRTEG